MRSFGIGNLVLMLPALQALHQRFPSARLDAITMRANRGFLERTGYFTSIWYLDDRSVPGFCWTVLKTLPKWRAVRYDAFLDFEQFARTSAILGLLLMIPRRIGFDTPGQGRAPAYTDTVPYRNDLHMMDGFYSVIGPLGFERPARVEPVAVPARDEEERGVDRWMRDAAIRRGERVAVVHPGTSANFVLRRWPEEYYAKLADFLAAEGYRVVLTGIPAEAGVVARVQQQMTQPAVNAVGRLSLGELLALLKRASLVVSNDTGPVHLAAAQGAPAIGLYGPNIPTLYGPRSQYGIAFYLGLPCSPCITNFNEKGSDCTNNICMKLMTADQVIGALRKIFEGAAFEPTPAGGIRAVPGNPAVDPRLVRYGAGGLT